MADDGAFVVTLERIERYLFQAAFEGAGLEPLLVDEAPPLGGGRGPDPSRLLATAVGNCLSASLLFCLERSHIPVKELKTRVTGAIRRNERGRLRVAQLDVEIMADIDPADLPRAARCRDLFEDFCVVTASVKQGVPVSVRVVDGQGNEIPGGAHDA